MVLNKTMSCGGSHLGFLIGTIFLLIVTMVSCCIPMNFLYQFSYGVRVNLGLKKLVQEEADLSTCSCRIRLHGAVYLIHNFFL
jgi:hypothetical protein